MEIYVMCIQELRYANVASGSRSGQEVLNVSPRGGGPHASTHKINIG